MDERTLRQSIVDAEHLKLLRLGYFVSAGTTALFALFGLFYVFMGVMISSLPSKGPHAPPEHFGWFLAGFGLLFTALGLGVAITKLLVAKALRQRRSRVFCLVIAGFTCLELPYGTLLGVLTFVVLARRSVAGLFSAPAAPGETSSSR